MKLYRNPLALAVLATLAISPALNAAQAASPKPPESLASRVDALEKAVEDLRLLRAIDATMYRTKKLDCSSRAYEEIQESNGNLVFFVTCAGIEPYMEGYRVTVQLGNPYATDFANTSLRLYYGKDVEDALLEDRHAKIELPNSLTSGGWTPAVFTISRARAEQFRYMALKIEVGVVSLRPPSPAP